MIYAIDVVADCKHSLDEYKTLNAVNIIDNMQRLFERRIATKRLSESKCVALCGKQTSVSVIVKFCAELGILKKQELDGIIRQG